MFNQFIEHGTPQPLYNTIIAGLQIKKKEKNMLAKQGYYCIQTKLYRLYNTFGVHLETILYPKLFCSEPSYK